MYTVLLYYTVLYCTSGIINFYGSNRRVVLIGELWVWPGFSIMLGYFWRAIIIECLRPAEVKLVASRPRSRSTRYPPGADLLEEFPAAAAHE